MTALLSQTVPFAISAAVERAYNSEKTPNRTQVENQSNERLLCSALPPLPLRYLVELKQEYHQQLYLLTKVQ